MNSTTIPNLEAKTEVTQVESIMSFITENVHNEALLTDYFSKLTCPLTPEILALPCHHRGEINTLLGHAALYGTKYLKQLVKLATTEAIDAALSEDPLNPNSTIALHALILHHENIEPQTIISIIQKATKEVISTALVKQLGGLTVLFAALTMANDTVSRELILKSDRAAVNTAAKITNGANILHGIIRENSSKEVVDALLSQLDPDTMDLLMLMPDAEGHTPFSLLLILTVKNKDQDYVVSLTTAFIKHTSNSALNILAKQTYFMSFDLLFWLVLTNRPQIIVDTILSRLDKTTLDDLVLKGGNHGITPLFFASFLDGTNLLGLPSTDITKETNMTAVYITNHISQETLAKVVQDPIDMEPLKKIIHAKKIKPADLKDELLNQNDFMETMAKNNSILFNEFVKKMLIANTRLDLTTKSIYRLDAFNLSRYLAQHPEIDMTALRQSKAYSFLFNWKYKPGFDARLHEAENLLHTEISFSLTVYRYLKSTHFAEPLVLIVMSYIERDEAIINRVNLEICKEKNPSQITELQEAYPTIRQFFPHDKTHKYRHNETAIVLDYMADHKGMTDVAIADFNKAKTQNVSFTSQIGNFSKTKNSTIHDSKMESKEPKHKKRFPF